VLGEVLCTRVPARSVRGWMLGCASKETLRLSTAGEGRFRDSPERGGHRPTVGVEAPEEAGFPNIRRRLPLLDIQLGSTARGCPYGFVNGLIEPFCLLSGPRCEFGSLR